jgi:hypothetical protein
MRKTAINIPVCSLFLTLVSSLFFSYNASAQIVLLDEHIPLKPTGFYIAGVEDNRSDKSKPAEVIIKNAANKLISVSMSLEGGNAAAIKRYIDKNLPKNTSGRPVVIGIEQLKLQETVLSDGNIEGRLNLKLSFSLEKEYGLEPLITYPGALRYRRSHTAQVTVERNLRRMIGSGLNYFDEWMKANLGSDRKLARAVKISFTDYQEKREGDTIYYDPKRPLTWADFQSRNKPPGMYQAAVMPSIGYTQDADLESGTLLVRIAVKAYVPKSACWANPTDRNDYYLNHEQRHFDIAKIIAEQFKKKLLAKKLTPDDYEGFINMQYLDSYRDMNVMQKAYDDETNHGINRFAQDTWNARIDKDLQLK